MNAYQWACKVMPRICDEYGLSEVELTWRRSKTKRHTSGQSYWGWGNPNRVIVTEGIDNTVGAKVVFLHEMAHLITRTGHHNDRFYRQSWELIRQFKLPITEAKKIEGRRGAGRRAYLASRPGKITYQGKTIGYDPELVRAFQ